MGKARSDSASPADTWLPEGLTRLSPGRENGEARIPVPSTAELEQADPEARQWLVDAPNAPPHRSATESAGPERQNGTGADRALKDAKQTLIAQREKIDEIAAMLAKRDAELAAAVRERDEALKSRNEASNGEKATRAGSKETDRARQQLDKALQAKDEAGLKLKETEKVLAEQRARISELEVALKRTEADGGRGKAERNTKDLEASLRRRLSKEYEKREADLVKSFDERQTVLDKQLLDVEERLDIREAELREQARERERTMNGRIEELESALAEAQKRAIARPTRRSSPRKNGKLDLNEATFEQLRDMGLTVTLSARAISYRDTRGGFESLDELDEIPGLSVEFKRVLREQLTVG